MMKEIFLNSIYLFGTIFFVYLIGIIICSVIQSICIEFNKNKVKKYAKKELEKKKK